VINGFTEELHHQLSSLNDSMVSHRARCAMRMLDDDP
jgi:hypothetical protein